MQSHVSRSPIARKDQHNPWRAGPSRTRATPDGLQHVPRPRDRAALALRDPMPAMVACPAARSAWAATPAATTSGRRARSRCAPFALARTPVTRAQYAAFRCATGAPAPPWWDDAAFAHPDHPVVGVTWFEAEAYAAWALAHVRRARGGCPRRRSGSARRAAASRARPRAWGDALPPGEVPDGPLAGPGRRGAGRRTGSACATWARSSTSGARTGTSRRPRSPRRSRSPRAAGQPRRLVASSRALVAAVGAQQPAPDVPLRRLRLPRPARGRLTALRILIPGPRLPSGLASLGRVVFIP